MGKSNRGQTGDESRRFGGQVIDDLNPRNRAEVQAQNAEQEKRDERKAILKKYPPYVTEQLLVGVRNSKAALIRFQECIRKENETIAEFEMLARQCELRDKELKSAGLAPR